LFASPVTLKDQSLISSWTTESLNFLPIRRFASNTVLVGLDDACDLAASPIKRSPSWVNATHEGVVLLPWSLAIISTRPFLTTPTLLLKQKKL
jgi:hypothetical protein